MIRFGTAGFPHKTPKYGSVIEALNMIRELGLDGMELEFVRGVWLKVEKTDKIKKYISDTNLFLTCHAPYYINLNAKEPEKIVASKKRIISSARVSYLAGAHSLTFHAGFYLKMDQNNVYKKIKGHLMDIKRELDREGINIRLSPETTGKPTQFGSINELVELADMKNNIGVCIDFSHLYARSNGKINKYEDFLNILNIVEHKLGSHALNNLHLHISGIEYGEKGEKRHVNFRECSFNYKDLLKALVDKKCSGVVICESPNLEKDALIMKDYYSKLI